LARAGPDLYQPMLKKLTLILGAAALLSWLAGAPRTMQHTIKISLFQTHSVLHPATEAKIACLLRTSTYQNWNSLMKSLILVVVVTLLLRSFEVKSKNMIKSRAVWNILNN
jgi:hypothetical protein